MINLGIDIDDVIFKTGEELLKVLENCDDEEILEHKLDIMRGDAVNEKVGNFLLTNVMPIIRIAKPMDDVSEIIKKLREESYKIILITARGGKKFPGIEELTYNRLKEFDIEYDDIIFSSKDKVSACKDNNIDMFVDDSPKYCLEVKENLGIPVIGFLSEINKEEMERNNIRCVDSWKELYNIINDEKNKTRIITR